MERACGLKREARRAGSHGQETDVSNRDGEAYLVCARGQISRPKGQLVVGRTVEPGKTRLRGRNMSVLEKSIEECRKLKKMEINNQCIAYTI